MSARFTGWSAAAAATLLTVALVVGELVDAGQRRWWSAHALTTDTVSGLLVLFVTVLVVNQLLNLRQSRQRGHAVASQAAVMVAQAARAAKAVSAVTAGTGDRAAADGFRTYMMMLLTSAPLLIDDRVARHFLEQAQYLGAIMGRTLAALDRSPRSSADGAAGPGGGLDDAMAQLKSAADPLLQLLNPAVLDSIQGIGQTSEE